jgi:hypothetical protein
MNWISTVALVLVARGVGSDPEYLFAGHAGFEAEHL